MKCVGCLFGGEKPIGEVPLDSTLRNRICSRFSACKPKIINPVNEPFTGFCFVFQWLLAERTGFEPCSAIYLRIRYFLFHLLWQVTIWILSVHFLSEPVSKNLYYTANINILFYLRKLFLFFCIQKSSIGCCLVVRVLFKQAE